MLQPSTAHVADFLGTVRAAVDRALDEMLPPPDRPPARLHEAMRYSVFGGGKRLRPALAIAAFRAFRSDWTVLLGVAGALELIHTYSLVHDDLPAMDDDDFRRGQLSCHRRFGEATAILAGDALLTLAFGQLASESSFPPALMKDLIGRIARSAGSSGGMIAGQMMDLDAEGGPLEPGLPEAIHAAKTGALFEASVIAGALLGGGDRDQVEVLGRFGRTLGLAFQVRDDMLDELGAEETLGKTPGKDRRQGKATYARLYGIEASREEVSRLTGKARESLAFLGERGALLDAVARELETRGR